MAEVAQNQDQNPGAAEAGNKLKKNMAKKLSDFIKNLIAKAGGNIEDEKIKEALATINADTELQDELVTAIDHGLISIANAKNNHPEIKGKYFADAYNGLDSEIDRIMADEGFSEEIVSEVKNEKSSTKRAVLVAKKIKELEAAKAGQGKADTKALNEKIAELNGLLRAEKESISGVKAEYEKKLRDKDKGYAMRNLLGGYTTIHDKLDPDTKNIIINAIIDKNLKSKGYILDLDDNGNLVVATKDGTGTAFAEDHTPLTAQKFLDQVMAGEKLLVVTDSNNNNNNQNRNNNNNNSGGNNNRNNNNSGGFNNRNNNSGNNNQGNNGNGDSSRSNGHLKNLVKEAQDALAKSDGASIF